MFPLTCLKKCLENGNICFWLGGLFVFSCLVHVVPVSVSSWLVHVVPVSVSSWLVHIVPVSVSSWGAVQLPQVRHVGVPSD